MMVHKDTATCRSVGSGTSLMQFALYASIGAVLLLLSGCAGSGQFSADETRIAYGYLPSEAEVPSHPDSLKALSIVEKENRLDIQLDRSYEELTRDWSSTWVSQSAQRSFNTRQSYRSFATLWSLDLSIASLVAEEGISGLSKDLARERIAQRRQEHNQVLQIDLYRFVGSPRTGGISSTLIGRPGSRVTLRDDQGNTYSPDRVRNGPPTEAFIAGDRTFYRRNIFYFNRNVDGRDIFEGVRELRLFINESPVGRYYFTWSFEAVSPAPSSP